jgi:hypothetical protein
MMKMVDVWWSDETWRIPENCDDDDDEKMTVTSSEFFNMFQIGFIQVSIWYLYISNNFGLYNHLISTKYH